MIRPMYENKAVELMALKLSKLECRLFIFMVGLADRQTNVIIGGLNVLMSHTEEVEVRVNRRGNALNRLLEENMFCFNSSGNIMLNPFMVGQSPRSNTILGDRYLEAFHGKEVIPC